MVFIARNTKKMSIQNTYTFLRKENNKRPLRIHQNKKDWKF